MQRNIHPPATPAPSTNSQQARLECQEEIVVATLEAAGLEQVTEQNIQPKKRNLRCTRDKIVVNQVTVIKHKIQWDVKEVHLICDLTNLSDQAPLEISQETCALSPNPKRTSNHLG